MRFLYVAPRYHTNQVPIMRGLKARGHEILFLSQYAGKVEVLSDLHPVVIGYSRLFGALDRCYVKLMKKRDPRAGDRKIKCGFPPFGALKREIRNFRPDVAILRERSVYSAFAYRICRKYRIPSILVQSKPTLGKRNQKRFSPSSGACFHTEGADDSGLRNRGIRESQRARSGIRAFRNGGEAAPGGEAVAERWKNGDFRDRKI